ncbi:hypothetical protein BS78_09G142900 [Paspalum vaginatum]|nr:hypothetical protein BS78_09G142900 [Paspalum vaginatum]
MAWVLCGPDRVYQGAAHLGSPGHRRCLLLFHVSLNLSTHHRLHVSHAGAQYSRVGVQKAAPPLGCALEHGRASGHAGACRSRVAVGGCRGHAAAAVQGRRGRPPRTRKWEDAAARLSQSSLCGEDSMSWFAAISRTRKMQRRRSNHRY